MTAKQNAGQNAEVEFKELRRSEQKVAILKKPRDSAEFIMIASRRLLDDRKTQVDQLKKYLKRKERDAEAERNRHNIRRDNNVARLRDLKGSKMENSKSRRDMKIYCKNDLTKMIRNMGSKKAREPKN